jgi:hypothetical protein
MHATILSSKPTSGSVPEVHWSGAGRNLWVRFEGPDPWVGVFAPSEPGIGGLCACVPFDDEGGRSWLVLAEGTPYVVDAIERRLLGKGDWTDVRTAVTVPAAILVLLSEGTRIRAYRPDRDHDVVTIPPYDPQDPARLALDGIRIGPVDADRATGSLYREDGWRDFEVDLRTLRLRTLSRPAPDSSLPRPERPTVLPLLE